MQIRITFDSAVCMYYAGIEPFTTLEVYIAKGLAVPRDATGVDTVF